MKSHFKNHFYEYKFRIPLNIPRPLNILICLEEIQSAIKKLNSSRVTEESHKSVLNECFEQHELLDFGRDRLVPL